MIRRLAAQFAGALALAAAMASPPARATIIVPQSVEEMTYRATAVVRAVPIAGSTLSFVNTDGVIVTQLNFTVLEVLGGDPGPGSQITVEILGGSVGDETLTIDQNSRFVEGEQVVLFLCRDNSVSPFVVLDLSAGKFEVAVDPDTMATTLTRRDFGEAQAEGGLEAVPRNQARTLNIPTTLDDMRAQVADADDRKADYIRRGINPIDLVTGGGALEPLPEEGAK